MTRPAAILAALLASPSALRAQAPDAASLWDIATTTLALPPALESGTTGTVWNPSAVLSRGLRVGFQSVETPDVVGISGLVAGVSQSVGTRFGVGLLYGRVQVSDLVRTTTSPVVQPGEIPVYSQFLGVLLGFQLGPLRVGGTVRGHDARFDLFRESGFTADVGASANLAGRLRLAASSQFVPTTLGRHPTERLYAGLEYTIGPFAGAAGTGVSVRYGGALRARRDLEHYLGLGLATSRLALDAGTVRERGPEGGGWRLVLAVGVRAGRYAVFAARGGGLHDVGASYRVGMDLDVVP